MTSPGQQPVGAAKRTLAKLALCLVLAGGIAYCNSFRGIFLLDDVPWITNTEKIKSFSEYVSAFSSRPFLAMTVHWNYRLHELSPFGYHAVNLAIHLAAALVLFDLVRRTLLLPRWEGRYAGSAHWLAFAVALLWVVHPLQTQAVTYIIQRCESMMGLFYLLTIYCMLRATQADRAWPWYLASLASCVIGAGSKEVMVTVLPILFCYDLFFIASFREVIRRRWWYYTGLTAIWALPFLVNTLPYLLEASPQSSSGFALPNLPPHVYWMTQAWVLLYYLRLCVFPYPQVFSHRGWEPTTEFADFWPAGLAIAIILLAVVWLCWRRHWLGFLGLWFFGILSITSIVPLLDVAFEHRLYLPLAAVCALFVFGGYWLFGLMLGASRGLRLLIPVTIAVSIAATVLTILRNQDYQSLYAMWMTVHEVYPDHHDAKNSIAIALADMNRFEEAAAYFEQIPETSPGMARYGLLLCRRDRPEEGLRRLLTTVKAHEAEPTRTEWRGMKHHEIGMIYWIQGDAKAAETHLRKATEINPTKPAAYFALALVLDQTDRTEEASAAAKKGLTLAPGEPAGLVENAQYYLQDYPAPSRWTRKEALFYALQAAVATEYQYLPAAEILTDAYAANGMFREAHATIQKAAATLSASERAAWQAQIQRAVAYREGRQAKANPGKKL